MVRITKVTADPGEHEELLTINDVAAVLRSSRSYVYTQINSGRLIARVLPADTPGGRTRQRIRRADLNTFIASLQATA